MKCLLFLGGLKGLNGYNGSGSLGFLNLGGNSTIKLDGSARAGFFVLELYHNDGFCIGWFGANGAIPSVTMLANYLEIIGTQANAKDVNLYVTAEGMQLQNNKQTAIKYRYSILGVNNGWR